MIEQHARIVAVDGCSVRVVTERQPGCQACHVKGGCGTSLIGRLFPERPQQLLDLSAERLSSTPKPGDRVLLGIDEHHLHEASLLLYATPLIGLIGGAVSGAMLGTVLGAQWQEPISVVFGLLGLSLGLLYVKRQSAARSRNPGAAVRLLRVEPAAHEVALPALREQMKNPDV